MKRQLPRWKNIKPLLGWSLPKFPSIKSFPANPPNVSLPSEPDIKSSLEKRKVARPSELELLFM